MAVYANLDRYARGLRAGGDPRSLGQIRADTLVERVTGQTTAAAVPVQLGLTMTATSLLDSPLSPNRDQTAAELDGYGPIPSELARDLVTGAGDASPEQVGSAVWVRRLFTDPVDDTVVHVDTMRRRFDAGLARLIRYRDRVCRDPYCTAADPPPRPHRALPRRRSYHGGQRGGVV